MADMILRNPRKEDEQMALAAHRASLAEGVDTVFLRAYEEINFDDFLEECHTSTQPQEGDKVPSDFFFAEVDGEVVGRTSIRHRLNDKLFAHGGNIGYYVLPAHRGHGYAKQILDLSLRRLAELGVEKAMVSSDDANPASWKTIEACGGVLENIVDHHSGVNVRRYWIDLAKYSG